MKQKLLIVFNEAPYSSYSAQEGIEALLLASGFQFEISVLFLGDSVLQLLKNQDSELIQRKNIGKMLSALPLFDVEMIYVEQQALDRYQLNESDLLLKYQLVDDSKLKKIVRGHDKILNF